MPISNEQAQQKISHFYHHNKRMPSYAEMMELFGYQSKNAVARLVDRLIAAGIVDKDDSGRLIPKRLPYAIPILGLVEAGFPAPAEEDTLETTTLDEYLIHNREASYLLEVKGDSMINAGIQEGDLVLAERTNRHRVGDIVIAEVDGEWTMKYLRQRSGRYFLEAANPNYGDIYPENDLNITGVVKGIIRKYE